MELQNQHLAHIIVTLTQAKINEGYKMKSSTGRYHLKQEIKVNISQEDMN